MDTVTNLDRPLFFKNPWQSFIENIDSIILQKKRKKSDFSILIKVRSIFYPFIEKKSLYSLSNSIKQFRDLYSIK